MMNNKWIIIHIILCLCFFTACGSVSPLGNFYENQFADFTCPDEGILKHSDFSRSYQYSFPIVWQGAMDILIQHATTIRTFRDSGVIFYLDIDGVLMNNKFVYSEFPFCIGIEEINGSTTAYAYPFDQILENKYDDDTLKIVKLAFSQKAQAFLENLSVQLTAQNRWPWLNQ